MTIALTTPEEPVLGKTHTTVVSFYLSGMVPTGWTLPIQYATLKETPRLTVVLLDGVRNGPGDFTGTNIRELSFWGDVVSSLLTSETARLRGLRRAIEDLVVSQASVIGTATND